MVVTRALGVSMLVLAATPAWADATLPTFAQTPSAPSVTSPWTGFYAGTEIFSVWSKGSKARVGAGFTAGYDRELPNNLVLGVQASTGYSPFVSRFGRSTGVDYATLRAKVGYDMGRLEPFITTGLTLTKLDNGIPGTNPSQSFNNLFTSGGGASLQASGTVGAGFNYAVTDHLHVGMTVTVSNGRGLPFQ